MRAVAIVLLVVTLSAFAAYSWLMSNLHIGFVGSQQGKPTTETSAPPRPQVLTATVASEHGWDLVTRGQQITSEYGHEPRTCAETYGSLSVVPHSGHTRVTLDVRPGAGRQLVVNAVRVRVTVAVPLVRTPTYLYHCTGPADPPVTSTRIEPRAGAVFPVEGTFPRQVSEEGYRQDIEVEVHGREAADWQVEVDYTLDGVSATQPATAQLLVTEPERMDTTGHTVWCDREWRQGESC
ncbi:hypothetical protein ABZ345_10900 [Lentzea sp. NPDC005914]|uniref:hypothetical protein n=1 Tax=Lentzea sp. NPDC005914 TaxID=3154572 RepID=UPI003407810C